ncbi:MAG: YggT family protein [Candidatus Omnitrophota bacterium]|nr:MAG: YggT family protein [Candidatus Omnitrophota bacterium]
MFVMANFIIALGKIINFVLTIYIYIIIFRAVISWVNPDPYNPIVQFLHQATEPVLSPIRFWLVRIFKRQFMIDISPVIAILAIWFLQSFVVNSLMDLAMRLK